MALPGPLPSPGHAPTKIGFNTVAMWGLCGVVVGVCYILERNNAVPVTTPGVPAEVQRVLPSGMWLMRDGSIKRPPASQ